MAIGFPASYKMNLSIDHLDLGRARILVQETLGRLGWKIISITEEETVAHTLKKDGEPSEVISFKMTEAEISLKSKGVKWKFADAGKNKENAENFDLTFTEITQEFEGKDLIDFSTTYNQLGF